VIRAALAVGVLGAVLVGVALATAGGGSEPGPEGATNAATGSAPPGLAVFAAQGCGSCHTFDPAEATGTMAPDLTVTLDGKPAGFIRESIVDPAAAAEPGWSGDTMPQDYEERMTPQELDALVAFLAAG
jgi:mono/diheme cytochrome c family protein